VGYQTPDTGYGMRDAGCGIRDVGFWILDAVCHPAGIFAVAGNNFWKVILFEITES